VPEEAGANLALLGGNRVLVSAAAPRTAELLAARGLEPVSIELGELAKLEGSVTCLSVLVPV
jgi:dimethylargininase